VWCCPETRPRGARIAERLRKAIEEHGFLQARALTARLSASFGISSYPDHALTPKGSSRGRSEPCTE